MATRTEFAVPLDRTGVRSGPAGNLSHADSQLPVVICREEKVASTAAPAPAPDPVRIPLGPLVSVEISNSTRALGHGEKALRQLIA
jgi:hypothetical protein